MSSPILGLGFFSLNKQDFRTRAWQAWLQAKTPTLKFKIRAKGGADSLVLFLSCEAGQQEKTFHPLLLLPTPESRFHPITNFNSPNPQPTSRPTASSALAGQAGLSSGNQDRKAFRFSFSASPTSLLNFVLASSANSISQTHNNHLRTYSSSVLTTLSALAVWGHLSFENHERKDFPSSVFPTSEFVFTSSANSTLPKPPTHLRA